MIDTALTTVICGPHFFGRRLLLFFHVFGGCEKVFLSILNWMYVIHWLKQILEMRTILSQNIRLS